MELGASMLTTVPWESIRFGWVFTPSGNDLTGFPAPNGRVWNLYSITGFCIRYEQSPDPDWHSLPIDPDYGGGYLILEDVRCSLNESDNPWR